MFSTINNNTSLNTPATGIVQKSNKHSYFIHMHQNSYLADKIFSEQPIHNEKKIAVLQVLLINKDNLLVEIVEIEKL